MKSLILKGAESLNLYPLFNRFTKNTATIFMLHGFIGRDEIKQDYLSADILKAFWII